MSKDKKIIIIIAILVVLLIILGRAHVFFIPFREYSSSMTPSIHKGDLLLINRFNRGLDNIQRGDLIVFYIPQKNLVSFKRVIGLPLEKIEIRNSKVYINEHLLTEPYITGKTCGKVERNDCKNLSFTLGSNQFFMVGDDRENSLDSRSFGPIQKEDMLGKPFYNISAWKKIENKNLPIFKNEFSEEAGNLKTY